ncbi:MAG: hypothetical protein V4485_04920 [Pseudomonadota bacterium]
MSKVKNLDTIALQRIHDREMSDMSITPRTVVDRDFGSAILASVSSATTGTSGPENFFTETYVHADAVSTTPQSHALRFGINVYAFVGIQSPKTVSIPSAKSSIKSTHERQKQLVVDSVQYSQDCLTDQEKYLCHAAIQHLTISRDVAVVLDIFVRNPNGSIDTEQKTGPSGGTVNVPKVHCVTLYKQAASSVAAALTTASATTSGSTPQHEFLVIDPSNSSFSYVLAAAHPGLKLCFALDPIQIYKSEGATGSSQHQWRDCTDVAVKLCFAFERYQDTIQTDANGIVVKSLVDCMSVKDLTNQYSVYDSLPKVVSAYPTRAHQSSDIVCAAKTTFSLKLVDHLTDAIFDILAQSKVDPFHIKAKIQAKYGLGSILAVPMTNDACMQMLARSGQELTQLKHRIEVDPIRFIEAQELALIGEGTVDALLT